MAVSLGDAWGSGEHCHNLLCFNDLVDSVKLWLKESPNSPLCPPPPPPQKKLGERYLFACTSETSLFQALGQWERF